VVDLRLSKRFRVADRVNLEFLGEAFNVANHQNVTGVNTTAYTVGSVSTTKTNTLTYTTAVPNLWGNDLHQHERVLVCSEADSAWRAGAVLTETLIHWTKGGASAAAFSRLTIGEMRFTW
jgi:hypothetical protein